MRPASADALIVEHAGWCRGVSLSYARGFPPEIDFDDVIQDGYVGLIKAARSFDPSRGVPFTAHAISRVRGEIADRLRQQTPGPRRPPHSEEEGLRVLAFRFPLRIDAELEPSEHGDPGVTYTIEDPAAEQPFADILSRDLLGRLPARERLVVEMSDGGYRLREIGDVLHVGEARACQLRARAYRQLAAMAA